MRFRTSALTLALIATLVCAPISFAQSQTSRAEKILQEIDDMWRGNSSYAELTMNVKTAHYERSMRMKSWSKGKKDSLVRITDPKKERGAATLKSGENVYTYLPKTDRTIRITSGMMMGSWMGSHFTNDDLVKESRLSEDYTPDITFEGDRDGKRTLEFTLIPKPDAAVVWGKIVTTTFIHPETKEYIPVMEVFYDEDQNIARTMTFTNIKPLGGRMIPVNMKVVPQDKPDEYTEIVYEALELNIPVDEAMFSLSELRKE